MLTLVKTTNLILKPSVEALLPYLYHNKHCIGVVDKDRVYI